MANKLHVKGHDCKTMATINLTEGRAQTKTSEELGCSPSSEGGLQQQSIYFSAVNIVLSITALPGNSLQYPCCPSKVIFPSSDVQTLVTLFGNN